MEPSRRGHLPIDGLQLYYEVHGDLAAPGAVPLLLVPGAFQSTEFMTPWVAAFADARPVIVVDQQGHGRTPDTPRPMSYERFGDDAAAVLSALEVARADVMGYSQGGAVGLQLALRHPQLVSKLVVMSATYRPDGWYPAVPRAIADLTSADFADTPIGETFRRHTSDPQAFETYVEKMKVLGIEDHDISDADMRSIRARAMVIVGDADGVRPGHAVEMFTVLGGGDEEAAATGVMSSVPRARLVVLPATSHISIFVAVDVLEPMITAFLDDVHPADASLW
ncbi:oxidoreductase [Actinomycetospora sp. NBRC 106375]|uniref:alpha/beta fold hydrolase n=1 Tax=Actinomycetospora sp. NBRC 106375 TaxID=3032207 RepID=UPI0024A44C2B|nr:alpha/beta hydrolase [Actinomycetospora sp. NBRC 106375]GLZ48962.1 oxidoreductase [Actinomycetospora sp. NBRC 106375]